MQKIPQKLPSAHHRRTLSGSIFAAKACIDNRKKLVKQQYLPICPHNMVIVGPLTPEIDWRVWGTPANFDGFHVLASLLQRCRSMELNQTFHDVGPSLRLVHCMYIFCQVQNSLCVQVCIFLDWQHYCTALEQWA